MGWHLVSELKDGWKLYTRGGLGGVYVTKDDIEVNIPECLLLELAADHIISNKISELEQLSDDALLEYTGLKTRNQI